MKCNFGLPILLDTSILSESQEPKSAILPAVTTSYAETANNSPAPTQLSTVCYRDLFDTENPPFNVDSNSSPSNSLSLTQDDNYSIASRVAQVGNTPPVASLILAEVPVPPKKKALE